MGNSHVPRVNSCPARACVSFSAEQDFTGRVSHIQGPSEWSWAIYVGLRMSTLSFCCNLILWDFDLRSPNVVVRTYKQKKIFTCEMAY